MQVIEYVFEGYNVRAIVHNNDIWFPVSDLCALLRLSESKTKKHMKTLPSAWKTAIEGYGRVVCDAGLLAFLAVSHIDATHRIQRYLIGNVIYPLRAQYVKNIVEVKPVSQVKIAEPVIQPRKVAKPEEEEEPISLNMFDDDDW